MKITAGIRAADKSQPLNGNISRISPLLQAAVINSRSEGILTGIPPGIKNPLAHQEFSVE